MRGNRRLWLWLSVAAAGLAMVGNVVGLVKNAAEVPVGYWRVPARFWPDTGRS